MLADMWRAPVTDEIILPVAMGAAVVQCKCADRGQDRFLMNLQSPSALSLALLRRSFYFFPKMANGTLYKRLLMTQAEQ